MQPTESSLPPSPRRLGAILDTALDLVKAHAALLIGLSALVHVPAAFVAAAESPAAGAVPAPEPGTLAALALTLVALPIVTAGLTDACGALLQGGSADAGSALRRGLVLALPLVATFLLFALVVLASLIPLGLVVLAWESLPGPARVGAVLASAVPPVIVMLRQSLLFQVAVLEESFGLRALARAHALIDGQVLRVVGVFFVVGLLAGLLGGVAGVAVGGLPVVGPAATGLVQAACFAYTTAAGVVLYQDVRARRGEHDGAGPAPDAPAADAGPIA